MVKRAHLPMGACFVLAAAVPGFSEGTEFRGFCSSRPPVRDGSGTASGRQSGQTSLQGRYPGFCTPIVHLPNTSTRIWYGTRESPHAPAHRFAVAPLRMRRGKVVRVVAVEHQSGPSGLHERVTRRDLRSTSPPAQGFSNWGLSTRIAFVDWASADGPGGKSRTGRSILQGSSYFATAK